MLARIYCVLVLVQFGLWQRTNAAEDVFENHPKLQAPLQKLLKDPKFDVWSLYLPTKVEVTSACQHALQSMKNAFVNNHTSGAHKWFDSWGKSSNGRLIGRPFYNGAYDECKNTEFPGDKLQGKYCKIKLKTFHLKSNPIDTYEVWIPPGAQPETEGEIIDILNGPRFNGTMTTYSTCIPDDCSRDELQASLIEVFNNSDLTVHSVDCHFNFKSDSYNGGDIAFVVLLGIFGVLLVSSSVLDIYIQKTGKTQLKKGGLRYLLPFSAYTNIEKLFHLNPENPPGTITCLHGMRVLSMTWVVHAHQLSMTFVYTSNVFSMLKHMRSLPFQALLNGFPSVDSFFFMSGFLMTYSVLREYQRSGRFNIWLFYFHRLLRLIPPIALVCGFYATMPIYFTEGPIGNMALAGRKACQDSWWREIIFIDNFSTKNKIPACLGQCWYVSVDTQFYLIAPFILLPLIHKKTYGMVWLYLLTVASAIIPASITYVNDLPPTTLMLESSGMGVFNLIYMMPWCRAGPILIGMWLGVFIQGQGKDKIKLKPWQVFSGWSIAILTGLLVVFGIWSYNVYPRRAEYDVMTAVTYAGLHRPAWAIALAWVVFACYNGYGGFVNDFLSHPLWQPFSRLTYSTYLIAVSLQSSITYNTRIPFYFSHYTKVLETVGALIIAIIPATLVSIMVESPIIGIEKLIFRRPGREDRSIKKTKELDGVDNRAFETIEKAHKDREMFETENVAGTHMDTRI